MSCHCREAQAELVERIKMAVALPVRTSIKDVYDDTCTELLVTAQLDSGEGSGLSTSPLSICVFMNTKQMYNDTCTKLLVTAQLDSGEVSRLRACSCPLSICVI